MITLLLVIALSSKSFDVTPEVCTDVHSLECEIDRIKSVAATVAESDVELEPVYECTKWPSLVCAHVESCHLLSDDTQDETYFK